MIFDMNYDKTLWLLLDKDINNRSRIVNFIRSIPNSFLERIQKCLVDYNNCKLEKGNKNSNLFYGDDYSCREYIYYFNIENDMLYIGRCACKYGLFFNDFELKLKKFENVVDMEIFDIKNIGEISYDYTHVNKGDVIYLGQSKDVLYKLVRLPLGNILKVDDCGEDFFGIRYRYVNVDDIPDDYNIEDIENNDVFMKTRKKSRKYNI